MHAVFLTSPELISLHWWSVMRLIDPVVHQAARGAVNDCDPLLQRNA